MASTMDKVKNVLHMNKDHSTTGTSTTGHSTTHSHGTSEGVAGPHDSKVANTADPRIGMLITLLFLTNTTNIN